MKRAVEVIDPEKHPILLYTMMSVFYSLFKNPYGVTWGFVKKKVYDPRILGVFRTAKQKNPVYRFKPGLYRSMYHVRPVLNIKIFTPLGEESLESTSFFSLSVLYATDASRFYRNPLIVYGDVSLEYITRVYSKIKSRPEKYRKLYTKTFVPGRKVLASVKEARGNVFKHAGTLNLIYYDGSFVEKIPSTRTSWLPVSVEFFHIQYDPESKLGRMIYLVNLDKKVVWWTW